MDPSTGLWPRLRAVLDVRVDAPRRPLSPTGMQAVLEAAADPRSVRTHPFTLRFASDLLENAFEEQYAGKSGRSPMAA